MKRKKFDELPKCKETNYHHLFPTSRYPELADDKNNKVKVPYNDHIHYHRYFLNRNPYEILDYLVETMWGGKIGLVQHYLDIKQSPKKRNGGKK